MIRICVCLRKMEARARPGPFKQIAFLRSPRSAKQRRKKGERRKRCPPWNTIME